MRFFSSVCSVATTNFQSTFSGLPPNMPNPCGRYRFPSTEGCVVPVILVKTRSVPSLDQVPVPPTSGEVGVPVDRMKLPPKTRVDHYTSTENAACHLVDIGA